MRKRKEKVLIVGAGPAGLAAAYKLLKDYPEKFQVTVIEASDAIGGISQTFIHNGNRIDIGGHRFFTKDEEVMELWNEIMPIQGSPACDYKKLGIMQENQNGPDPDETDDVFLKRNRVSRIFYLHKFFDYPVSINPQTVMNLGLGRTVDAGLGYLESMISKMPEENLENFMINRFGRPLYQMFFRDYTEKLWGRHPKDIDASWGTQRIKGLSLSKAIAYALKLDKSNETSLIEDFYYPKFGPGQLYEKMADKVREMGGKILMKHRLTNIVFEESDEMDSSRHISYVVVNGKKTMKPDILISSMPIKDLFESMKSDNEVDESIQKIASGLPYRDFITVGLLVDKLKLKNETAIKTLNDRIPDNWIYVQEKEAKMGRIQIFNNWSPYMVHDNEETVWLGLEYFCNESDENDALYKLYSEKGPDEFAQFAIRELVQMGILDAGVSVKDYVVKFVEKAYPAYFDTYSRIQEIREHVDGFDNLFCIGRNGQHRYNNMDHSIKTGLEVARYIAGESKDKSCIWNVNTDKGYHEEK